MKKRNSNRKLGIYILAIILVAFVATSIIISCVSLKKYDETIARVDRKIEEAMRR